MQEKETKGFRNFIDDKIDEVILNKRRIFLSDAVDSDSAKDIIRKLWYLDSIDNKSPILFVINSPGGSVDSGFAIWDQIKMISSPVYTLVSGLAASMGSILSISAKKGRRLATPSSRIMIHQPLISGVIKGQATDLEIQAKEMLKTREIIVDIYAEAAGESIKKVDQAIDRDNWMTVDEAVKFGKHGLLDHIVSSFDELHNIIK